MTFPDLKAAEWTDTGTGLKVWDVTEGTGTPVPAGSTVTCHYTGWLTDGTKFDSSLDSGKPISFSLKQVIKGWTDGIPGMKPDGVRRLYIPYAQGYGERGYPGAIPGKADLVFEVKLVSSK